MQIYILSSFHEYSLQLVLRDLQTNFGFPEAPKAIDQQAQEIQALRNILISERAQVIYYSEQYLALLAKECFDLVAVNFLDLDEALQEPYVKRAIQEPYEQDAKEAQQQANTVAKNLFLPKA